MMKLCRNENNMYRTRRKYYVVGRKLDSNQCGLRSILGFHAIYGLSLLLILYSAPSGFVRVLRLSPLLKTQPLIYSSCFDLISGVPN